MTNTVDTFIWQRMRRLSSIDYMEQTMLRNIGYVSLHYAILANVPRLQNADDE